MIDGITVLNQVTQYNPPEIILLFVLLGIVSFVVCLACSTNDAHIAAVVSGCILVACIIGFVICFLVHLPERAYQEYQVTISDDVNYKEFTNRYMVTKQEGQIYTIREFTTSK